MKEKQIDLKGRAIKEVRDNGKSLTVEFETKWEPKPGDVCESGDGVIFIYKYKDWDGAIFYATKKLNHRLSRWFFSQGQSPFNTSCA